MADSYSSERWDMISAREVKEFLSQAYYTSVRMQTVIEQINMYRTKAMKETAAWSDAPGGQHSTTSLQAIWIEKAVDLQEQWKDMAEELIEKDKLSHSLINMLSDERAKCMLEDRHIWRMSLAKMCMKHSYSQPQIWRIMNAAYKELAEIISSDPDLEQKIDKAMQRLDKDETL